MQESEGRKVWVIANQPYEDRIADYRYFEDEGEASDKCQEMNNHLRLHNSNPVWKVYEANITIVRDKNA